MIHCGLLLSFRITDFEEKDKSSIPAFELSIPRTLSQSDQESACLGAKNYSFYFSKKKNGGLALPGATPDSGALPAEVKIVYDRVLRWLRRLDSQKYPKVGEG